MAKLGTSRNPGEARALPPTLQMKIGRALQSYLGELRNVFPEVNPVGEAIEDFFLEPSEQMTADMAAGNPYAVIDPRPNTRNINPAVVDTAALLPVASVAKIAATPAAAATATGMGLLGLQMGGLGARRGLLGAPTSRFAGPGRSERGSVGPPSDDITDFETPMAIVDADFDDVIPLDPPARPKKKPKAVPLSELDFRTVSEEEAKRLARRGVHLRQTEDGTFVGGPREVTSKSQLRSLRRRLDKRIDESAQMIRAAIGAGKVGQWYPETKAALQEVAPVGQESTVPQIQALYSAQASPEGELGFSLGALNQHLRGEPITAKTGQQNAKAARHFETGEEIPQGPKTGAYRERIDWLNPAHHLGVNDFRWTREFGYTNPDGTPWTGGTSSTMHSFIDAETLLAAERANKRAAGGHTDWTGQMLQEVPWITQKARDMFNRDTSGSRFGGDFNRAIEDAARTVGDYMPKHTVSATYEAMPGASTGHRPDVAEMSPEEYALFDLGWAGEKGHDPFYQGMYQRPVVDATGSYRNIAGELESNPVSIARPLVDLTPETPFGQAINPGAMKDVEASEGMRALIDAQEAGAAHLPNVAAVRKAGTKTSALIDNGGKPLTAEQLDAVNEIGKDFGLTDVTASDRGAVLANFGGEAKPLTPKQVTDLRERILKVLPDAKVDRAGLDSTYVPAMTRWDDEAGDMVPTTPGSGEATVQALRRYEETPRLAERQANNPELNAAIQARMARDELSGAPIREDLQRTREFFSEADWSRAVKLMKQGMSPAAAIASLGYSLSGMAAENEPSLTPAEMRALFSGNAYPLGLGGLLSESLYQRETSM